MSFQFMVNIINQLLINNKCLIIIFCFLGFSIPAQNEEIRDDRKNEIGFSLSDLVNGAFQVNYERMVGKRISVGMGLGYKGDQGLIRLSGLDGDQLKTNDITYSGFKLIPEVRYYINSTTRYSMDGFYFGAFVKYSNYSSDLDGTYIDSNNDSFIVEFDADFNVTSIGFMIGYKLPISKRFSINFLIAGPGVAFHNYELINRRDLPDEFYEDLNEALEEYSIFDFLNGDFRFSSLNGKTSFTLGSLRYGITLGYSF